MRNVASTNRCEDELDVYDQCCSNCHNTKCPAYGPAGDDPIDDEKAENQFREDSIEKDGSIIWCIHWKGHEPKQTDNDADE